MKTRSSNRRLAVALAALAIGGGAAHAATTPLPALHRSGGIEYLSGGVGHDEARAVERAARHWPLTLEFAVKNKPRADFAADVRVHVRDAKGHTTLDARSDGPFLLAKLPPGRYRVDASLDGRTLHEKVQVKAGHPARAVFLWPAGTDESAASHRRS